MTKVKKEKKKKTKVRDKNYVRRRRGSEDGEEKGENEVERYEDFVR